MGKFFNTRGLCNPQLHYMVDISGKIKEIMKLVAEGKYFTINRPRQYGKTTTLLALEKKLIENDYAVISISFEGLDSSIYQDTATFVKEFLMLVKSGLEYHSINKKIIDLILNGLKGAGNIAELSRLISELIKLLDKKVVLMIDEVDKSGNNQLFLDFLGMLRNKYLQSMAGKDNTFQSIILAGVYDVKTLKLKLRSDDERKYNSPWNIAADFNVDMSFNPAELETMLEDYSKDKNICINIKAISEKLYYYTSGYPFLASRLCEIIDSKLMTDNKWDKEDVDNAVNILLKESNPNFEDMIKNLENNNELYEFASKIVLDAEQLIYNNDNPIINLGALYGIFKGVNGKIAIHNRIYEQRLYNYMSSKQEAKASMRDYNFQDNFIEHKGLDMEKVLLKFQQFMKEQYNKKDVKFVEREGKLLFLAFIKPIINGRGFDFKEVQVSEERRLDVVVTYLNQKYIIELKIWRGQEAHKKGMSQLKDYLDRAGVKKGYLVIFDFTARKKPWGQKKATIDGKEIFMVRV